MNRFFTLLFAASCLTAVGQEWNPDSDNNGQIGVGDLQSLLSVYGLDWDVDTVRWAYADSFEVDTFPNGASGLVVPDSIHLILPWLETTTYEVHVPQTRSDPFVVFGAKRVDSYDYYLTLRWHEFDQSWNWGNSSGGVYLGNDLNVREYRAIYCFKFNGKWWSR